MDQKQNKGETMNWEMEPTSKEGHGSDCFLLTKDGDCCDIHRSTSAWDVSFLL